MHGKAIQPVSQIQTISAASARNNALWLNVWTESRAYARNILADRRMINTAE